MPPPAAPSRSRGPGSRGRCARLSVGVLLVTAASGGATTAPALAQTPVSAAAQLTASAGSGIPVGPFAEIRATTTAAAPAAAAAKPADPLLASHLPSGKAWTTAVRRTRSWVRGQGASMRFALKVDKRTWSYRGHDTTHSNSLIKATVLIAYVRRASVRHRALTSREKALLTPMIHESANGPVNTLIGMMGGVEPLRRVGRLVGMEDFRPQSGLWGASLISALDEARLFARLYSIVPPRHRDYALGLLRHITASQRWGMPKAAPRGWRVSFKSGWNGTGRVVQAMRLTCKGHVISASVLVDGASQGGSEALVEKTGRRLMQPLRVRGRRACSTVTRPAG